MAFLEQLAERQPGMPRKPEVPGAGPTPSRPADKVNPPAVASGPIGRPSQPPPAFPGGAGRALPNVSKPAAPAPTTSPSAPRPAPGPTAPSGAVRGATGTERAPGALGTPMQQIMDRVPTPAEMASMDPSVEVVTPYGTMNQDGSIKLSPEGEMKYKEAVVARRKKLGPHPFAADPNAPAMEVRLGGRMFNPFTGRWVGGDEE